MHTIFSDGDVWPTVRIEEARRHGLDAVAITDHLEGHPKKEHVGLDQDLVTRIPIPAGK
jgi:predicted metal-dependent phosphoesterase TrpH